MNEDLQDEAVALRKMLAENGWLITLPRLIAILEEASQAERDCEDCDRSEMGLCWGCLVEMVRVDLEAVRAARTAGR